MSDEANDLEELVADLALRLWLLGEDLPYEAEVLMRRRYPTYLAMGKR